MADPAPQSQPQNKVNDSTASQAPQDYASVLIKVIEDVSKDPVALRRLVYALAWHNLKPESLLHGPTAPEQARTILELERALEFQRAVEQVEAHIARLGLSKPAPEPQAAADPAIRDDGDRRQPTAYDFDDPARVIESPLAASPSPDTSLPEAPKAPAESPAAAPIHASQALIMPPERPPHWLQHVDRGTADQLAGWVDHRIRLALETMDRPAQRKPRMQPTLALFLQLTSAVVFGVALYVGIAGWVHLGRQTVLTAPPTPPPPRSIMALPPNGPDLHFNPRLLPIRPPVEAMPSLPFPLPKAFGVYAVSKGELFELEPLPIKIPDPRILVSAEISKPSRTTVSGEKLAFVVFRRDLLNSAPPAVPIRVIARVQRSMKFVNGKPTVTEVQGTWRIRAKSYEFKVSPIEGQREMVMIEPDANFVFPAGRYALVLA
jgi:hypothetical protein